MTLNLKMIYVLQKFRLVLKCWETFLQATTRLSTAPTTRPCSTGSRTSHWAKSRSTSCPPGWPEDSSTTPSLTDGPCLGKASLMPGVFLNFPSQGLLALEPQVLPAQVLRGHSLRPDVCRVLRPLLSHELRLHLRAQEPEIPLVDPARRSTSVQFSS